MPFVAFDRSKLKVRPLRERAHDITVADLLPLNGPRPTFEDPALPIVADRIRNARLCGAPVVLMMGAHPLKVGISRFLIDLVERGFVGHIAMNGAGIIHDWELALVGATSESVARYVRTGEFGLWTETGSLNDVIARGALEGMGLGEAIGRAIQDGGFPHKDISVLAAAAR